MLDKDEVATLQFIGGIMGMLLLFIVAIGIAAKFLSC